MSDQPRDPSGRFATATEDTGSMMRRVLNARGRPARIVGEAEPGNRELNEAVLRAAGKLPPLDEDDDAAG